MQKLTNNQVNLLMALKQGPLSVIEVSQALMGKDKDSIGHGYRRLEDRGLVRRLFNDPAEWELTAKGHDELDAAMSYK